jgi:hypothetical protein
VKSPASKRSKWVILRYPDYPYVRVIYDENNPEGIMTIPNEIPEETAGLDRQTILLNLTMKILHERYATRLAMVFGGSDKAEDYLETTIRANLATGYVTMAEVEDAITRIIARPEPVVAAPMSVAQRSAESIASFYSTMHTNIPYIADASLRAQQIGTLTEIFAHFYFYGSGSDGL